MGGRRALPGTGGASQTIRAVRMGGRDARALRAPRGAAAFLVISTGFLENESPLWFERTLYRGDSYEFRNRLEGLRRAGPAVGRMIP